MNNTGKKKIGFLMNQTASGYTEALCCGAQKAAKEWNADLYVFSGSLERTPSSSDLDRTAFQRNVLYEYSLKLGLDAVVIAYDGVKQSSEPRAFERYLKEAERIPCVFMEAEIPGKRCIQSDQESSVRSILEHMVREHGLRKIGCLRGPVGSPDADVRYHVYEQFIKENGLDDAEDYTVNGTFSGESGENIRILLQKHPDLEGVICCNDLVAMRVEQILWEMGRHPGVDFAVAGCDNVEAASRCNPPLTTIEMDISSIGYYGVVEAIRLLNGEPQQVRYVPSRVIYRESCGCHQKMTEEREPEYWSRMASRYERQLAEFGANALLAPALTDAALGQTVVNREVLGRVADCLQEMQIDNGVLLLFPNPIPVYDENGNFNCAEQAQQVLRFHEGETISRESWESPHISVGEVLQNVFGYGGRPKVRMVFVLQCEQDQFGLFICRGDTENLASLYMACYQLGSMLKFISLQSQHYQLEKELHGAVRTITEKNNILQRLSNYDALTQIYNRRGLIKAMQKAQEEHHGEKATLLFMDLNNLKQINDIFGHNAGDYAISSFAEILKEVLRKEDIIGRFGGDEFMALLLGIDSIQENEIRGRIQNAFQIFNEKSERPFYVEASIGLSSFRMGDSVSMETLFDSADQYLYLDKQRKRRDVRKKS